MTAEPDILPDAAGQLLHLDEAIIRTLADSRAFGQGRTLQRKGHVSGCAIRGRKIEGVIRDGRIDYAASVVLPNDARQGTAHLGSMCECFQPGSCKHVIALLLAWVDNPGQFAVLPSIADQLGRKNPAELIAIIERMVELAPDLERVITLPPPSAGTGRPNVPTLDPVAIDAQAREAMRDLAKPFSIWDEFAPDFTEADELMALSKEYGDAGLWADAHILLAALSTAAMAETRQPRGGSDELDRILVDCDSGLSTCLAVQTTLPEGDRLDSRQREQLIRAIYDQWRFGAYDYDIVGPALGPFGPGAIAQAVTPAERDMVDRWLAAEQGGDPAATQATSDFRILLLEAAGHDDERMLAIYREAGRWPEVATRLIAMDRIEEAAAIAREHLTIPITLLPVATDLAERDRRLAIRLVEDRAWEVEGKDPGIDRAYERWLMMQGALEGKVEPALAIADRRFDAAPSLESWSDVRDIALMPGQAADAWDSRRVEMMRRLGELGDMAIVVRACLEDEHLDAAAQALQELRRQVMHRPTVEAYQELQDLQNAVSLATETLAPDRAIATYRDVAGRLIAERKRESYQLAAHYLERVFELLKANDRADEWQSLIDEVRSKHKKLRALREELDALDLR